MSTELSPEKEAEFEAIRRRLSERQISLLGHYVADAPYPEGADDFDHEVLAELGLIKWVPEEAVN